MKVRSRQHRSAGPIMLCWQHPRADFKTRSRNFVAVGMEISMHGDNESSRSAGGTALLKLLGCFLWATSSDVRHHREQFEDLACTLWVCLRPSRSPLNICGPFTANYTACLYRRHPLQPVTTPMGPLGALPYPASLSSRPNNVKCHHPHFAGVCGCPASHTNNSAAQRMHGLPELSHFSNHTLPESGMVLCVARC